MININNSLYYSFLNNEKIELISIDNINNKIILNLEEKNTNKKNNVIYKLKMISDKDIIIICLNKIYVYLSVFDNNPKCLTSNIQFKKDDNNTLKINVLNKNYILILNGRVIILVEIFKGIKLISKVYKLTNIYFRKFINFEIKNGFTGTDIKIKAYVNYENQSLKENTLNNCINIQDFIIPFLEKKPIINYNILYNEYEQLYAFNNTGIIFKSNSNLYYQSISSIFDSKLPIKIDFNLEQNQIDKCIILNDLYFIIFANNKQIFLFKLNNKQEVISFNYNKNNKCIIKYKAYLLKDSLINIIYVDHMNEYNIIKIDIKSKIVLKEEKIKQNLNFQNIKKLPNVQFNNFYITYYSDLVKSTIINNKYFYNYQLTKIKLLENNMIGLYSSKINKIDIYADSNLNNKTYEINLINNNYTILDYILEGNILYVLQFNKLIYETSILYINLLENDNNNIVYKTKNLFDNFYDLKENKNMILVSSYGDIQILNYSNNKFEFLAQFTYSFSKHEIADLKTKFESLNKDLFNIFSYDISVNKVLNTYKILYLFSKKCNDEDDHLFDYILISIFLDIGIINLLILKNRFNYISKIVMINQIKYNFENFNLLDLQSFFENNMIYNHTNNSVEIKDNLKNK